MRVPALDDAFLAQAEMPYVAAVRIFDPDGKPYPDVEVRASFIHAGSAGELSPRKTDANGIVLFPLQWDAIVRMTPVLPSGYVSDPEYRDVISIPRGDYSPKRISQENSIYLLKGGPRIPWSTIGIVAGVAILGYLFLRGRK